MSCKCTKRNPFSPDGRDYLVVQTAGIWMADNHWPLAPKCCGTHFVNSTAKVINKDFRKN